jgi:hypothetical protein
MLLQRSRGEDRPTIAATPTLTDMERARRQDFDAPEGLLDIDDCVDAAGRVARPEPP